MKQQYRQQKKTPLTSSSSKSPYLSTWKPPSSSCRIGAVGKFKRPTALVAACRSVESCYPRVCVECSPSNDSCCPHSRHVLGSFEPKIHPEMFDWLGDGAPGEEDRNGQSFAEFAVQLKKQKPGPIVDATKGSPPRTIIYLCSLDEEDRLDDPSRERYQETLFMLRDFVHLYFGVPCQLVTEPWKTRTSNSGIYNEKSEETAKSPKVLTGTLERAMYRQRETVLKNAFAVVGVTRRMDLCPTMTDTEYEVGEACPDKGVAVVSLLRFGNANSDNTTKFTLRAMKIVAHEVGHLLGLGHCIYYQCVMNGWAHLDELDESPMHLCPVCLRKVHHAVSMLGNQPFHALERYKRLAQATEEQWGQPLEAEWYKAAAQRVQGELDKL